MRRTIMALVLMIWGCAGSALAQDSDDWDFIEDRGKKTSLALVDFGNFAVAVRCDDDVFSVLISGLPETTGGRWLGLSLDGAPERGSYWISGKNSAIAFSVWPRYVAEQVARGGRLGVSADDGQRVRRYAVDLPRSEQSVGKVMQACGKQISDSEAPSGESLPGLSWVSRPEVQWSQAEEYARYDYGLAALRCRVNPEGRLRDCATESEFPEGSRFARAASVAAHRGGRVRLDEGAGPIPPGRFVSFVTYFRTYDVLLEPPPTRMGDKSLEYNPLPREP